MLPVHNKKKIINTRRYLRNHLTKAETTLWFFIRDKKLGYKFRRQHSTGNYIIDFYCFHLKLAVELDGGVHNYYLQNQKDYLKEQYLKSLGITIIRYTNSQVLFETGRVLDHLQKVCAVLNRQSRSNITKK
ncbi:MAG: DUF559 domain-containing protein [Patescibacteria group bacterium]